MNQPPRSIRLTTYKWTFDLPKLLRNAQGSRRHWLLNAVICDVAQGAYWIAFANGQTVQVAPTNDILNSEAMRVPLGNHEDSVVQTNIVVGRYNQLVTHKDSVIEALLACRRNNYEADVAAIQRNEANLQGRILLQAAPADNEA